MPQGKISENNTRVIITIPKETKTKIEKIASMENRSLSNLIVTIINKYIDNYISDYELEKKRKLNHEILIEMHKSN